MESFRLLSLSIYSGHFCQFEKPHVFVAAFFPMLSLSSFVFVFFVSLTSCYQWTVPFGLVWFAWFRLNTSLACHGSSTTSIVLYRKCCAWCITWVASYFTHASDCDSKAFNLKFDKRTIGKNVASIFAPDFSNDSIFSPPLILMLSSSQIPSNKTMHKNNGRNKSKKERKKKRNQKPRRGTRWHWQDTRIDWMWNHVLCIFITRPISDVVSTEAHSLPADFCCCYRFVLFNSVQPVADSNHIRLLFSWR